jgi:hypothetical protein
MRAARLESRAASREAAEETAIVYRRTNPTTGRCYIGRCGNEAAYRRRQMDHNRQRGVRHEYEVIERPPASRAREAEQRQIDAHGGPTNRRNPNGGTENRRNEIRQQPSAPTGSHIRPQIPRNR